MKIALVLAALVGIVALSGCESLSDATAGVREQFAARNQPRTKTFSAPERVVFQAVKQAASDMGYRMTYGGPAERLYQGLGGVAPGEYSGSARQVALKVRLHETPDETSTEVSVWFSEIIEPDSSNRMGMATQTTMRDTPLYEVFFRQIQQRLNQRPTAQPVKPAAQP